MNGRELIRYPRYVDSSHPKSSFLLVLGFVCARLAQLVRTLTPGPHSHILLMGGGGVKGSEILAKRKFLFGPIKDTGIFWVMKKVQGFFWVLYFSSAHINNKISTIYCWCGIFFGYAKKVGIFWGRHFKFFLGLKYETLWTPPVIIISEWGPGDSHWQPEGCLG